MGENTQRRASIDFAAINSAALPIILPICRRLAPGGKVMRGEYVARNPTRADKTPGSFSVNLKSGKWAVFATNDRGGDCISLAAYILNTNQVEAARAIAAMVGIDIETSRHG